MNDNTFRYLLDKVGPRIERRDDEMGKTISVEQRLATTTIYLATGRSLEDIKLSTLVSPQALDHIIPETCKAISEVLRNKHLRTGPYTS